MIYSHKNSSYWICWLKQWTLADISNASLSILLFFNFQKWVGAWGTCFPKKPLTSSTAIVHEWILSWLVLREPTSTNSKINQGLGVFPRWLRRRLSQLKNWVMPWFKLDFIQQEFTKEWGKGASPNWGIFPNLAICVSKWPKKRRATLWLFVHSTLILSLFYHLKSCHNYPVAVF